MRRRPFSLADRRVSKIFRRDDLPRDLRRFVVAADAANLMTLFMSEPPAPLIVSLLVAEPAQARLNALRAAHFPPERNFLAAHLTLFHALPGGKEPAVAGLLRTLAARLAPPSLHFPGPRFLGRGVALAVESPALCSIRAELAAAWRPWLGAQDRQGWRPHVTVQNKVAPAVARTLHAELAAEWEPFDAVGAALALWRYRGGPWEAAERFPFTAPPAAAGAGAPARLPTG